MNVANYDRNYKTKQKKSSNVGIIIAICTLAVAVIVLIVVLASGGDNTTTSVNVDLDLSKMSDTFVYSQIVEIMKTPNDYLGKTIKMQGTFQDGSYPAVVVNDATACCSQGFEVIFAKGQQATDGQTVTIIGQLASYQENGKTYYHLIDTQIV